MFRARWIWAAVVGLAPTVVAAAACDNDVIVPGSGGGGAGVGGEGQGLGLPSTSSGGVDAGRDATSEFVDPGCTDPPPPVYDLACDPYAQGNGDCGLGEGCYIFVQYPDEPCGQEIYGSFCMSVGPGGQGDPCMGPQDCGGGHVCVVTGAGTQCVELCPLEGPSGCPSGMVCEPIDVEGFGGCL